MPRGAVGRCQQGQLRPERVANRKRWNVRMGGSKRSKMRGEIGCHGSGESRMVSCGRGAVGEHSGVGGCGNAGEKGGVGGAWGERGRETTGENKD